MESGSHPAWVAGIGNRTGQRSFCTYAYRSRRMLLSIRTQGQLFTGFSRDATSYFWANKLPKIWSGRSGL
jgi:hypothetical protein